jgi:chromosome segregation ATPase
MAFNDGTHAESSRHGSDDTASGVFVMTALPDGGLSEDDDCDFFEDSFNRLVVEFEKSPPDPPMSESFAKLAARADRCRGLRASIDDLRARLHEESRYCEISRREEAERQRESDGMIEHIRKMEEDATKMENSTSMMEERAGELERVIGETNRSIALGPGWTEEQQKRRRELSDAIDRGQCEATENNVRLTNLRSRLSSMEKEVEDSIRRRDQSIEDLERVSAQIGEEQEKEQAVLLQCREAERSKGVLAERLRVAEIDLADMRAEYVNGTKAADDYEQEVDDLRKVRESCSRESDALRESEDEVSKELSTIVSENMEIEAGNVAKRNQLDEITKEVQR